ncbi:MAG: cation:proton antiporter [Candidatus Omnitrophota bacterium]
MNTLLIVGAILFLGFLCAEIAKRFKLPAVTGYLVAGVLLNPSLFHIIPANFNKHTDIVTNLALCFITFSIGGTLLYSKVKTLGRGILYITIFEAECAFIAVVLGFLIVAPHFVHVNGATMLTFFLPLSLLVGSLASPTDPTAALAVTHEYQAQGEVTSTILGVAAFDDALGIMNYSIAVILAQSLITHQAFSVYASFITPLIVICGSLALGVLFGFVLNYIICAFYKEGEGSLIVIVFALLALCFGAAHFFVFDELLSTMTMGVIVVNFCAKREEIFQLLERYTEELIFVLFFTLSGMQLNFAVLSKVIILVVFFSVFRFVGKVAGTAIGAFIAKSDAKVRKYVAGGLIPQGGIVIGLALMMKQNPAFAGISENVICLIIGTTIVHEFIGPIFAKMALVKAGEIKA